MTLKRLTLVVLAAASAYFAVFGGTFDVFDVRRLERELAREVAALESVREEIARLEARADSLESDPAALERIAREWYGMIRPGERLYRFAEPAPASGDQAADGCRRGTERCREIRRSRFPSVDYASRDR